MYDELPTSDELPLEASDLPTPAPRPGPTPVDAAATILVGLETKPPPPRVEKIAFLDGLRGLSAMLVVAHHAKYDGTHNVGQPAVDFFFVLSAFLLTLIFEKTARQLRKQRAPLRSWILQLVIYFERRVLRVYPLFALIAIFLAWLSRENQMQYFHIDDHSRRVNALEVLTFNQGSRYFVFWTMAVEVQYYFFIPVFVMVLLKLGRFWLLLVVPSYAVVFYAGFHLANERDHHGIVWPHLPTLLCGSLGAVMYTKLTAWIASHQFVFSKRHVVALRTLQLTTLSLIVSDVLDGLVYDWLFANPVPHSPGGVCFVSVNLTIVIICEMLQPGPVSAVLEWAVFTYAGKVSFSMYLLHPFIVFSPRLERESYYYNRIVLTWGLVFLLAIASYHIVERPSQLLAGRIGKWLKSLDVQVAAVKSNPSGEFWGNKATRKWCFPAKEGTSSPQLDVQGERDHSWLLDSPTPGCDEEARRSCEVFILSAPAG